MNEYRDPDMNYTKRRIQLLVEEWDLMVDPKRVLQDILDSWPDSPTPPKEKHKRENSIPLGPNNRQRSTRF
jgi:hypothetical protein